MDIGSLLLYLIFLGPPCLVSAYTFRAFIRINMSHTKYKDLKIQWVGKWKEIHLPCSTWSNGIIFVLYFIKVIYFEYIWLKPNWLFSQVYYFILWLIATVCSIQKTQMPPHRELYYPLKSTLIFLFCDFPNKMVRRYYFYYYYNI